MNHIEQEVWQVVSEMNRAWAVDGDSEVLRDYFHQNMVAITATDRERLVGRDACVAGWKDFMDKFETQCFRETDPQVQVYSNGACAVVTYYFEVRYSRGGETFTSTGRDMFVLAKEDGKWWIVADQFSNYPRTAA